MDKSMRQNYGQANLSLLEKALELIKAGIFKREQVKAYDLKTKDGFIFGENNLSLDGGIFTETYINSETIDGGNW